MPEEKLEPLVLLRITWRLAIAGLPAIAFLVVVHWAVLAALFATGWLVRRKGSRANHRHQNREQDFRIIFHTCIFGRERRSRQPKVADFLN